jgi:hypothetical protein
MKQRIIWGTMVGEDDPALEKAYTEEIEEYTDVPVNKVDQDTRKQSVTSESNAPPNVCNLKRKRVRLSSSKDDSAVALQKKKLNESKSLKRVPQKGQRVRPLISKRKTNEAKGKKPRQKTTPSPSAPEMFQIESILRVRNKSPDEREYFVKWLGFGLNDATWEPEANLIADCPDILEIFHAERSQI